MNTADAVSILVGLTVLLGVLINIKAPLRIADSLHDIAVEMKRQNDLTETARKAAGIRRQNMDVDP